MSADWRQAALELAQRMRAQGALKQDAPGLLKIRDVGGPEAATARVVRTQR